MGVVYDAVEDGVGDGGFADHLMPARDWQLGGNDGGPALVSFLKELQQIEALLVGQAVGSRVVKNEELDTGELVDQPRKLPIEAGGGRILEEAWHSGVGDRLVHTCSLMGESTGQPGLPCASLAGEDDLLMRLEPAALAERENLPVIEATGAAKLMSSIQALGKRIFAFLSLLAKRLSARWAASRSSIRPSHSLRSRASPGSCSVRARQAAAMPFRPRFAIWSSVGCVSIVSSFVLLLVVGGAMPGRVA